MCKKHWWNDTDREKQKYWEKNLSLLTQFVHYESHMDWFSAAKGRPLTTRY
jgi:hypothetical protein